jgi:hypothetical protein
MRDLDNVVKTLIAASLIGLFSWMFAINADVKVHEAQIIHIQQTQRDSIQVTKELTKAVTDLRIAIEKIRN